MRQTQNVVKAWVSSSEGTIFVEETEREAYGPCKRRDGEEHVEEGGAPVAAQQVSEREPYEDGDDHSGL